MKVGDAETSLWLEGAAERMYSLDVMSERPHPEDEPVYAWNVEEWQPRAGDEGEGDLTQVGAGKASTYADALGAAVQLAERHERMHVAREKRGPRGAHHS